MPTILSRFDMIFIVKDEHSEERDTVSILITQYFAVIKFLRLNDEWHSKITKRIFAEDLQVLDDAMQVPRGHLIIQFLIKLY